MRFDRIAMLLHVAEKAYQWPSLKKIHDAALEELFKLQNEPEAEPTPAEESAEEETNDEE